MLIDTLDEAVISVSTFMHAGKPFETRITCYFKGHPILGPEFLQFRHDTISDTGCTLSVQAIHHGFDNVELVLDGKIDEVGIDKDLVRRSQGGIMFEEQSR